MEAARGEVPVGVGAPPRAFKWIRLLALAGCALSATVSVLYLVVLLLPQLYFTGYIEGHVSLLGYRLHYNTNGNQIRLPNLDVVTPASIAMVVHASATFFTAALGLALLGKKPLTLASLAYGASLSLVVASGVLRYVSQAYSIDVEGIVLLFNRGTIKIKTLAGLIEYPGVVVGETVASALLFKYSGLVIALLYASVAISTTAVVWAAWALRGWRLGPLVRGLRVMLSRALRKSVLVHVLAVMSALMLFSPSWASTFTYYPLAVAVLPQPPPATLEAPPYAYTCTALTRTARGALAYTDFETYPVSGWASYGGAWELSTGGGFRGNALRGRDNNGGVGGRSSQYYWNTRVDGYSSLWVSVRARAETADGYKGIGLMNADRNRLYEISVQSTATIYKWDGAWRLLGSTSVPGYSATRWYTLVLHYVDRGTSVDFTLWIYDDAGALVATLTASDTGGTRFRPAYAGVTIDATTTYWFRFDDFIVSTADPRSILFSGFVAGMRVEVWDNLGNLVNSTVAPAASFSLGVTRDIVAGTGVDGRVLVRYPDAYPCLDYTVPTADAILGGDSYGLTARSITASLGANKTSAAVTIYIPSSSAFTASSRFLRVSASQALYARLVLDSLAAPATLNLDLWLEGATRSTNITIRGGAPVSGSTNVIPLNLGLNNFVALAGHFTATGQSATLYLRLELCTAPGGLGACVYYPLSVTVMSGSSALSPSGAGSTPPGPEGGEVGEAPEGPEGAAEGGEEGGDQAGEPGSGEDGSREGEPGKPREEETGGDQAGGERPPDSAPTEPERP